MSKLFEPVNLEPNSVFWDYRIHIEDHFKGYYHWHQCWEFLLVHEGVGSIVVNQQTFEIRRGMFFCFQPYQLHQVYADVAPGRPYIRSIFYGDPRLIDKQLQPFPYRQSRYHTLCSRSNMANVYDLESGAEGMEYIFEQYERAVQQGRGGEDEELAVLFLQMINYLPDNGSPRPDRDKKAAGNRSPRYANKVMSWVENNYHEKFDLDRLAKELHLSRNYVSRIFREETGTSITEYLTARRVKQACRLLEKTDLSVEHIGNQVGFDNASYFINLFKKELGTTPLRYRNQHSSVQP